MPYTAIEKRRIIRKAKSKLGVKQYDAQDKYTFMQQCMADMIDSGEAGDGGEARDICELMWEEEADLYEGD